MDFYTFKLPLLIILAALGWCSESSPLAADKINGVVGKNVTFKTTITSTADILTVTWTFNKGQPIGMVTIVPSANNVNVDPAYVNRISCNKTTFQLQLGPLVKGDTGEYILTIVTTSAKQETGQIYLEVLEPVTDVKISSDVSEPVEFNSTVLLTCSAKGSFTYKWINGSVPLVVDGTRMQLNTAGNELKISEVRRTDLLGPIFCIAENALESGKSAPFNLTVSYGPENILMNQFPTDSYLKKGSSLTLSCAADSNPPASIQWMFNGVNLPLNAMSSPANFTLNSLEEKNSGNYTCVAYNAKTKRYIASQVAFVTVVESLSGTNISSSTSFLIAGNSTVNLTCSAAAGRADTVEWVKDGKPLNPDSRIVFSADKKSVSIDKVVKEDRGEYRCLLRNRVNKDEASYNLNINYGPEKVEVKGKHAVKFEDYVELYCTAESVPPSTYKWKLNDTALNTSQQVYIINKAEDINSGMYTCEAFNNITGKTDKTTHKLAVTTDGKEDTGLSGGAIAGIVIGVIVAVIIIACIIKRRKKSSTDIPSPY
ncbi:carcinoembryonic antigen-related cell adhesion molecule 5 [Danio aesculapii]|uniref:carcinoembryonic antigen-related cell adhesion molecule 5 n=1 Tax=Danio aesculapii TaxID=1142201 RepID=UPI0024BF7932|nr:carcinoembryonic antigen-related cell adhesion molecule 5 [Danio aesculapii]